MKRALIHGTRICQIIDPATDDQFEVAAGLQWVNVADDTTTLDTYVDGAVVKAPSRSAMESWTTAIEKSDSTMIPRWLEDHIEQDHGGVTAAPDLQGRYNAKKALRAQQPE